MARAAAELPAGLNTIHDTLDTYFSALLVQTVIYVLDVHRPHHDLSILAQYPLQWHSTQLGSFLFERQRRRLCLFLRFRRTYRILKR